MYDWSEGGDTEVVVEDIERLNMDFFDKYDKQQQDWRMQKEVSWPRVLFINYPLGVYRVFANGAFSIKSKLKIIALLLYVVLKNVFLSVVA